MAWTKNGTPLTLGSTADDLDITDLTAKKFNVFLIHLIQTGAANLRQTFNDNTNSVYARRVSYRGGTDSTSVSQANLDIDIDENNDEFHIQYCCSISTEEKLGIGWVITRSTAGAGTFPDRQEYVYKFVPSPDADVTRIDLNNTSAGSYDTNTNISALGTD